MKSLLFYFSVSFCFNKQISALEKNNIFGKILDEPMNFLQKFIQQLPKQVSEFNEEKQKIVKQLLKTYSEFDEELKNFLSEVPSLMSKNDDSIEKLIKNLSKYFSKFLEQIKEFAEHLFDTKKSENSKASKKNSPFEKVEESPEAADLEYFGKKKKHH